MFTCRIQSVQITYQTAVSTIIIALEREFAFVCSEQLEGRAGTSTWYQHRSAPKLETVSRPVVLGPVFCSLDLPDLDRPSTIHQPDSYPV